MSDKLPDSGAREVFSTGMVREPNLGRGRYDLISPIALFRTVMAEPVRCMDLNEAMIRMISYQEGNRSCDHLAIACRILLSDLDGEIANGLHRLAIHYERGALKYADRNWETGGPFSRHFCSAFRHMTAAIMSCTKEDHVSAIIWNLFCIMHHEIMIQRGLLDKGLDDMPRYMKSETDFVARLGGVL